MKFIIEKHTEKLAHVAEWNSIDFEGPFDSIEEAEAVVRKELGSITKSYGVCSYSEHIVTRMIIYPLRDGVEYSRTMKRIYDFGSKTDAG